ncbi:hydantoinase/oxoprolinase family protein [Fodinicola acaciae]|uniref:hydantoinase/oxoprolinase family protein n=1 Tax=Fodinicola acaciae TaxID=2681555 RepID=UPI0013D87A01|nr:hydantoinase/oxoprolinase family protein [Fodinicola acaciae]
MPNSAPSGALRTGVDIGGTFTDLAAVDSTGIVAVRKVLTTADQPARGVEQALLETIGKPGVDVAAIGQLVHGTTLITNALIERTGSVTALLTTAGFRDVLEMAREHRYELYDLMIERPLPLVPRYLRFGVPERVLADGTVALPLDGMHVQMLAHDLARHGVTAVAVCFLHSYANPEHERQAAQIIRRVAPRLRVAISSDVVPEIREYERSSTTVANVYVRDLAERYLTDLRERTAAVGIGPEPHIMLSNGGVATVDTAARHPIRMLESGPAGGALAAAAFGAAAGHPDLLAFDMGGTTAKLCVVQDGAPLVTHTFEVDRRYRLRPGSGLPVKVPVIDMIEIGVGGGSLARTNALGLLAVGPESAGSAPGPACYGRGGDRPTVTDADLLLGYLDPRYFLGGDMELDVEAATNAVRTHVAEPLGLSTVDAAWGVHALVNEDMANAARVHTAERGQDPGKLPLVAFGGAGPVHAAGVAAALGSRQVIVPPAAGVLSSVGFLTAPLAFDFAHSAGGRLDAFDAGVVRNIFAGMENDGRRLLADSGVPAESVTYQRFADLRYTGQGSELRVPVTGDDWPDGLVSAFHREYRQRYGRVGPDVPVEVLTWRVVASGPRPEQSLRLRVDPPAVGTDPRKGSRPAYFSALGGFSDTPVFDRYRITAGFVVDGPALVEERESTVVVPPGARCTGRADGSLLVEWTA